MQSRFVEDLDQFWQLADRLGIALESIQLFGGAVWERPHE